MAASLTARSSAAVLALLLGAGLAVAVHAAGASEGTARSEATAAEADLPAPFRRWLAEVDPLITEAEREAFLELAADYQRRAFIEAFWRVRDPFPETAGNELRERWEERAEEARQRFDSLSDPRARIFLMNGEPAEILPVHCGALLFPLEVWHYRGSELIRDDFHVVFLHRPGGDGPAYRLWSPAQGLATLTAGATPGPDTRSLLEAVARRCVAGGRLAEALEGAVDFDRIEREVGLFPDPGEEWLHTFRTYSTDVPEGTELLPADLRLSFPGSRGGRTVVQGVVSVPRSEAVADPQGGDSFDYLVDGEVLRRDDLFEHFRYRFRLRTSEVGGERVPLVFQRYLRPGAYRLVVRVEELASERFYRVERELEVPFVRRGRQAGRGGAPPATPAADQSTPARDDGTAGDTGTADDPADDPAAEANRLLGRGEAVVRLLPPPEGLQVDNTRIEATVEGEGVARVRFDLDGRPVMSKGRPPYSVELDLGEAPRTHEVTAVALDRDGEVLGRDRILVNAGPHRFSVRLVEPQPGHRYATSLRAVAEVTVPEGDTLDRVEIYLQDELVATLYQPPYAQPVVLGPESDVTYVRAVAHLADGNHVEDVVVVNAPDASDRLDVHFVELYTSVVDRRGRPVEGLEASDFRVFEEGVEQEIRRFELVRDLPIYAGVLLDTSSSMAEELNEALAAALSFFETVITPRDRAAVIVFNHAPQLAVRFTANSEVLAGGLSGITAAGGTALHDSLIYALYYFSGVQGKRALVLITDGEDQGSRYGFDEALDYARRTGVSIYAIGMGTAATEAVVRTKLIKLASETGGASYFIDRARELTHVYARIERELRTQYLLAYQSSADSAVGGDGEEFRTVRVEVDRPGAEAKTLRGYYP